MYCKLFEDDEESIALELNKNSQANALSLYTFLKGTASMARSGIDKSQLEYGLNAIIEGIKVH
jgi:hypothetical protein